MSGRDAIATILVAAVAIPYVGYLVRGEMPFIQDPRGMAGVGLVGLVLSFAAWGIGIHSVFGKVMLVLGLATLGVGIAAAIVRAEGSELLLAIFMGAIAVVHLAETAYDAGSADRRPARARASDSYIPGSGPSRSPVPLHRVLPSGHTATRAWAADGSRILRSGTPSA